jgi:hypothetical protein
VPNIPSDAWQLAGAVSNAGGNAREWIAHMSPSKSKDPVPRHPSTASTAPCLRVLAEREPLALWLFRVRVIQAQH